MVLKQLVEDEIKEIAFKHLENPEEDFDYGERIDKILGTHSCFPAADKDIEKQLEQYSEELKDKEVSREEYISELEDILDSEDYFKS